MFGRKGGVGVIEINGVILKSREVVKTIEDLEENSRVKSLLVRLNSPGGAVAPSQEIYEAIKSFEKPVVASMGTVAASGGYYIACGAKHVFANPGTLTGSIGVIMNFVNLTELYDWAKVKRFAIKSGQFKDTGADYDDMTDEERALIQDMVDNVLKQFKSAVQEGRKITQAELNKVADGRIMTGDQALEHNLVDELGTFRDAVKKAGKLANIEGEPELIYPEKDKGNRLLRFLLDDEKNDYGFPDNQLKANTSSNSLLQRLLSMVFGKKAPSPLVFKPGLYWLWDGQGA